VNLQYFGYAYHVITIQCNNSQCLLFSIVIREHTNVNPCVSDVRLLVKIGHAFFPNSQRLVFFEVEATAQLTEKCVARFCHPIFQLLLSGDKIA
jgi:hypothetical protein